MKPRKTNSRKASSVVTLSPNSSVGDKLTHASILLGYQFDHGVDFQRRIISITGEINEDTYNLVDVAMTEMESASQAKITLKINSTGGDPDQALAIVGRIKESNCSVVTKGYGVIMSAATLILASGDKRLLSKFAQFMHHEMSYTLGDTKHSEAQAYVKYCEELWKLWAKYMGEFSKKSPQFWLKNGVGVDAYYTPQELLDMGVVDELF